MTHSIRKDVKGMWVGSFLASNQLFYHQFAAISTLTDPSEAFIKTQGESQRLKAKQDFNGKKKCDVHRLSI